jgi:hypothetical protein
MGGVTTGLMSGLCVGWDEVTATMSPIVPATVAPTTPPTRSGDTGKRGAWTF